MTNAFQAGPLLAFAQSSCSDAASPLECRLHHILNLLVVAAVILGIVLVGVIVLAIRAYLHNKNAKLEK